MGIIKKTITFVFLLPVVIFSDTRIDIFTISSMPVFNGSFGGTHSRGFNYPNIYALDAAPPLDIINEILSTVPVEDAKFYAEALLKEYEQQLNSYYQGKLLAKEYGLTHLPAVVINQGEYIIYGLLDIDKIVEKYIN